MKRGARPKILPGTSRSLGEANTAVAERLADWQQNLSDQVHMMDIINLLAIFYYIYITHST